MRIEETNIAGCYELIPQVRQDERGHFVKIFHEEIFASHGLTTHFAEEYYTYSHQRVLRGLHFQMPPMDHAKVVACVAGSVADAFVDLRSGSPSYGKHHIIELNDCKANMLYLPSGIAHGFYVQSASAILLYKVTSVYAPEQDSGILWNSADISWPDQNPILSLRDKGFVSLADFRTPFKYNTVRAR